MQLQVLTRSYRGEETISTAPVEIPANAPRELTVLVSDGRQLNAIEQRELRGSLQPQTIAQLVKVLNDTRRNNRIYIRLLTGSPGAVVKGEAMTALPPSADTSVERMPIVVVEPAPFCPSRPYRPVASVGFR